jgi:hypothetical protein
MRRLHRYAVAGCRPSRLASTAGSSRQARSACAGRAGTAGRCSQPGHGERSQRPDAGPAREQPPGPVRRRGPGGGNRGLLANQAADHWWQQDRVLAEPQVAAAADGQDVGGPQGEDLGQGRPVQQGDGSGLSSHSPLTSGNLDVSDASMLHRLE